MWRVGGEVEDRWRRGGLVHLHLGRHTEGRRGGGAGAMVADNGVEN